MKSTRGPEGRTRRRKTAAPRPVSRSATIREAARRLRQRSPAVLEVTDGRAIVGVIPAMTVRNAVRYGLGDTTVSEWATPKTEGARPVVRSDGKDAGLPKQLPLGRLGGRVRTRLRRIGRAAEQMNCRAYAVGGIVRDLLLGKGSVDLDIAVLGDAIRLAQAQADKERAEVALYPEFGTAHLTYKNDVEIDLASLRRESYERPGALPAVKRGTIAADLFRRDFTLNAIAAELSPGCFGVLLDYYGGLADLRERRLRVLHALSFIEDPTRLFRLVRFETRFGFQVEPFTADLRDRAIARGAVAALSGDRIRSEVDLLAGERDPSAALLRALEIGLFSAIAPGLGKDRGTARLIREVSRGATHFARDLERKARHAAYWLALLEGLDEAGAEATLQRLGFSGRRLERLLSARRHILARVGEIRPGLQPSSLDLILSPLGDEALLFGWALARKAGARQAIEIYIRRYRRVRPRIGGEDLERMGLPPGPRFGEVLDAVRRARLDGLVRSAADEKAYVWGMLR